MELYLLRHGQATPAGVLTDKGREDARAVLARAAAAGVAADLICSSPLPRARMTAQIAAEVLGYRNEIVPVPALAPDCDVHELWDAFRELPQARSILLVGHNPLLSHMVAFLAETPALEVELQTATLVAFTLERAGPQPRGRLRWMLPVELAR